MRTVTAIVKNFFRHDCLYLATNISFCGLLSLIPMILIAVSITGFLLGSSNDIYQQLVSAIVDLLPQGKDFLMNNLREVVGQRHSLGVLGAVMLLFIASILFGAMERSLDIIFESEKRRNFLHSRLVAIGMIMLVSLFFFMPTIADLLTRGLVRFGFYFPLGDIVRGKIFLVLFTFFAFVAIVVIVPHHKVRFRYAAFGGLFFAFGVWVARLWFRWYMVKAFSQYNVIYGSITAMILLLLWFYYVSNILLFSAEIVSYLQQRHRHSEGKARRIPGSFSARGGSG
ncbi:MAG: YihY/virulence factor BrkB family protein [Deltaproteobacteria bacterium]|nr:YihY/virulence factor BrkB family protein [Deltaproteobacteria bacterium]